MTKRKVAEKLIILRGKLPREVVTNALNISSSALQMYENGKRMPKDEIKVRIANYYGVTVQSLFFEDQLHETCGTA